MLGRLFQLLSAQKPSQSPGSLSCPSAGLQAPGAPSAACRRRMVLWILRMGVDNEGQWPSGALLAPLSGSAGQRP